MTDTDKEIKLLTTIFNGLVKVINAIKFKSTCCKSSCNTNDE